MRKRGFILIAVMFAVGLSAQKTLNIYRNNLTILNVPVETIDSVKLVNNSKTFKFYLSDKTSFYAAISAIDSINFTDSIQQYKLSVSTLDVTNISKNTASSGVVFNSFGTTDITEMGICWSTSPTPTINDATASTTTVGQITNLELTNLVGTTTYYIRAYAKDDAGVFYGNELSFTTSSYSFPSVEIVSTTYNYTTQKATSVVNVTSNGGCTLVNRGICWSTNPNPTINDRNYQSGITTGQFYALAEKLSVDSTYYLRAFATNCVGTAYSKETKFEPMPGKVTFTLALDSASYPTQYNLIKQAMDSACWYYSRYTRFKGNVYVYYNAGIPTAQASYHGSIGFGPNSRYMWVGTAMHEMAHYLGSGTTSSWQNLMVGGVWQGSVASSLLKNATGETLKGDSQHFWPYGINQKEEITGLGGQEAQANALMLHCKLVQAMILDDAKLPSSW